MEQLGVVAEAHEGGGLDAGLGDIVDLQAAALVGGGLDAGGGLGQNGVQVAGGDAHTGRGMHHLDQVEQVFHPLAGLGRQEDHGRIGHISQLGADLLLIFLLGAGFLLDEIPLVDGNDGGLAGVVCQTGDLGILIGDAGFGVDHQDAHVGPLAINCLHRGKFLTLNSNK